MVFEGHSAAIYITSLPGCFLSFSLSSSGFYAHIGVKSSCGKKMEQYNFCTYPPQKLGADELFLVTWYVPSGYWLRGDCRCSEPGACRKQQKCYQ